METGGRKDVRYNVLCRQVLPEGRGLQECGPNVRFLPRRLGLSNTSVMVADLQAHTNYSFLLEAVNGVSELAQGHAAHVTLNVTTNQAGEWRWTCWWSSHQTGQGPGWRMDTPAPNGGASQGCPRRHQGCPRRHQGCPTRNSTSLQLRLPSAC